MELMAEMGNGKMHLTLCDWTGARNPDRDIFLVAIGQEDAGRGVKFNGPLQPSVNRFGRMQAGGRPMQKL